MLRQRYPYASSGRVAAPIFAAVGLLAGVAMARVVSGGPGPLPNALLWGGICGAVAFLVFSSTGPGRPESIPQASAADGVVTGILAAGTATLLDLLVATGAGSGSGGLSSSTVLTALEAVALGALAGGALGLIASIAGGEERFRREPLTRTRGRKTRGGRRARRR